MKICMVASSGGHWEELMCLKDITKDFDAFFVTEEGGQADDSKFENIVRVPQINRHEKGFLRHFLKLVLTASKIIKKEKPDVIITTGALICVPFCYIAKLKRKKIVYIESFARVHEKSLSGKLVHPIADKFLVQWEPLLKLYPKAEFFGGVF